MYATEIELGEKTKLFINSKEKASLRTTIPISIVHQWGLKKGDYIDWSWVIVKNEMAVIVKKVTTTNSRRKSDK
jgi:hypothetical protein